MSIFFTMLAQRNNTICGIIPDSGFCALRKALSIPWNWKLGVQDKMCHNINVVHFLKSSEIS
jgi:hypothetical protein